MPISSADFRSALSRFASGVTVVTTKDATERPFGITVSAFCSVSLDPPLVLICIEKSAGSHHAFEQSGRFTVNILSSNETGVSEHFASLIEDKFAGIDHAVDEHGVPILQGSLATLQCKLFKSLDGGDHSIFLGEVEHVIVRDAEPLIYYKGGYRNIQN
ncbi:MAG: flavin reductase family protein [bacterium]|nr:flavin reductase family protein [bacterium]